MSDKKEALIKLKKSRKRLIITAIVTPFFWWIFGTRLVMISLFFLESLDTETQKCSYTIDDGNIEFSVLNSDTNEYLQYERQLSDSEVAKVLENSHILVWYFPDLDGRVLINGIDNPPSWSAAFLSLILLLGINIPLMLDMIFWVNKEVMYRRFGEVD